MKAGFSGALFHNLAAKKREEKSCVRRRIMHMRLSGSREQISERGNGANFAHAILLNSVSEAGVPVSQ